MKMKIEISEYIQNLAAEYLVESLGEAPTDSEALFAEIRVKKSIVAGAEVTQDTESGETAVALDISDIEYKQKDTLLDKFYINEWKKAYTKAIIKEMGVRFPGEMRIL